MIFSSFQNLIFFLEDVICHFFFKRKTAANIVTTAMMPPSAIPLGKMGSGVVVGVGVGE